MSWIFVTLAVICVLLLSGFRVAQQYERGVVFRFGRYTGVRGPGLFWIIPLGIENLVKVDMRVLTDSVEQQETMTKDNVPIHVNAVIWYRVVKPERAIIEVQNFGQYTLDDVLKERDKLSLVLKDRADQVTEPWGVEIQAVEMRNVEIPASMQRAMAQEAEALREKRARIIKAEAELEAARKLREAADEIMKTPASLELRRMQMLTEVGAEQNSMTIIMMPSEFVEAARTLARGAPAG